MLVFRDGVKQQASRRLSAWSLNLSVYSPLLAMQVRVLVVLVVESSKHAKASCPVG